MNFRRKPNPNRNHPLHCPYCSGTQLFPDAEGDFAWKCTECLRVFSVMFHGQDDSPAAPQAMPSSAQALQESLNNRGHATARDSVVSGR